jgi:hypothetical protein
MLANMIYEKTPKNTTQPPRNNENSKEGIWTSFWLQDSLSFKMDTVPKLFQQILWQERQYGVLGV